MLRKLFGRLSGTSQAEQASPAQAEVVATENYEGYELQAAPMQDGKTWRVAGAIVNTMADDQPKQEFVRADTCASRDDAVAISLRKARQIVDEQARLQR